MRASLVGFFVIAVLTAGRAAGAAPPPLCTDGTFIVQGDPLDGRIKPARLRATAQRDVRPPLRAGGTTADRPKHPAAQHEGAEVVPRMPDHPLKVKHRAHPFERVRHAPGEIGVGDADDPPALGTKQRLDHHVAAELPERGERLVVTLALVGALGLEQHRAPVAGQHAVEPFRDRSGERGAARDDGEQDGEANEGLLHGSRLPCGVGRNTSASRHRVNIRKSGVMSPDANKWTIPHAGGPGSLRRANLRPVQARRGSPHRVPARGGC